MFVLKISVGLLIFFAFKIDLSKCQGGRNGNGGMGGGQRMGMGDGQRKPGAGGKVEGQGNQAMGIANKGLPPGYANIRGEVMDVTNKLIQRVTSVGTNYFSYDNQNGAPVFKRREVDSTRRFVLFPDMNFPPGDGHYIVLRKLPGVNIPGLIPQALYEAFQLSLGDSIHGYVTEFSSQQYLSGGGGSGNANGRTGLAISSGRGAATSGFGRRKKRKSGLNDYLEASGFVRQNMLVPMHF